MYHFIKYARKKWIKVSVVECTSYHDWLRLVLALEHCLKQNSEAKINSTSGALRMITRVCMEKHWIRNRVDAGWKIEFIVHPATSTQVLPTPSPLHGF
jgi:hypothetical protein